MDGTMDVVCFFCKASELTEQIKSEGRGDKSPNPVKRINETIPI